MEVLKNVLIKEVDGSKLGDRVFIIDNLPKDLLYRKALKRVVDIENLNQPLIPDYKIVEGRRVPTGELVDELIPGIEASQTGDGGYCFFTQYNEARMRLMDIDNYLKAKMPVMDRIPTRIPYAVQPGVLSSGPRPLSDLPRVVLPEPVSPPAEAVQVSGNPSPVAFTPKRKPLTEEQKAAARERLAKARAMRQTKSV